MAIFFSQFDLENYGYYKMDPGEAKLALLIRHWKKLLLLIV
jgi:hypothetical protein